MYKVRAFDPVGMPLAAKMPRSNVVYCKDELDAAAGADLLVIATEWNQFRGIDPDALKSKMKGTLVCDLRNIYDPEAIRAKGLTYVSVGRA